MKEVEFALEGNEYIEMVKLFKLIGLVGTGGEAKMRVEQGEATYNGEVEFRKRKKLYINDVVVFNDHKITIVE